MAEGDEHLELKFRIFDGTDIGHGTYSSSITVATLKQRLLAEWPQDKSVVPKSVSDMKLIHAGKVLENGKTLAESRVHIGDLPGGVITMHVVVQPAVAKKKTEHYNNDDEASLSEEMKCVEIDLNYASTFITIHENSAKVVQNALNKTPTPFPKDNPTSHHPVLCEGKPLSCKEVYLDGTSRTSGIGAKENCLCLNLVSSAGNMEKVENSLGFGCGLVNNMMSEYNQIAGVIGHGVHAKTSLEMRRDYAMYHVSLQSFSLNEKRLNMKFAFYVFEMELENYFSKFRILEQTDIDMDCANK
ncbi:UNVERIFIED_CONTAM: Membrane-anchored ubiquitin-fold protein 3 [Sesamum indicum]